MAVRKKIPMRKCLATGEMKPKKEMIRIVRSKDGEVSVDITGKKPGRGAYVSLDREAIVAAKKKNIFASQLNAEVDDSVYEELIALLDKESKPQ
ncbi:YlxR family protein [Bacillus sp. FJAT-49711]|uniref:RNase P modulator RnpM n=1 Tax=Bacillus sp. FJAT-49711 TaxID=2833585 RepID=UPI001BC9CB19|nr:YlxR family protein [Bacillus sp. FJAT-49711]MBS4217711.1 YlxR family protein [Bacillus sp. FJAT-49711]